MNPTEKDAQKTVAEWLDYRLPEYAWCHVPNEYSALHHLKKTKGPEAFWGAIESQKKQGRKDGVPDILIFKPPPRDDNFRGTALELKSVEGSEPTEEQMAWLKALARWGWLCNWKRGAEDAISWLETVGGY